MAYGIKYYISFDDLKFSNTWRVDLLFKDYSGAETAFTASGRPIAWKAEGGSGDRHQGIRAKSVSIEMIAPTYQAYLDIFNANQGDVQCKLYKGSNLMFWGYVIQDEYSEPMWNVNHVITVVAVDGLSLLNDIEYTSIKELLGISRHYPVTRMRKIILGCLNELGYEIPLLDATDFYCDHVAEDASPLEQMYLPWSMFREAEGYKDCHSVLEDVITGCRLMQVYITGPGLCWLLEPIHLLDSVHTARVISYQGGEESSSVEVSSFVTISTINHTPVNVITDLSGYAEIDNTPGKMKLTGAVGYDNNLVKDPYYYTEYGDGVAAVLDKDENTLELTPVPLGTALKDDEGVQFPLGWANVGRESIVVAFDVVVQCKLDVFLFLRAENGKLLYYKSFSASEGQWREATPLLGYDIEPFYSYEYKTSVDGALNVISPNASCSMTLTANESILGMTVADLVGRLYIVFRAATTSRSIGPVYLDLSMLSVKVVAVSSMEEKTIEQVNSSNYRVMDISLPIGDAVKYGTKMLAARPNSNIMTYFNAIDFPMLSFDSVVLVNDDTTLRFAETWYRLGNSESSTRMELMRACYDQIYSSNRARIDCDILGQMDLNSILIIEDRLCLIDNWDLDVKSGIQVVKSLEIGRYDQYLVTESSEATIITESDEEFIEINP